MLFYILVAIVATCFPKPHIQKPFVFPAIGMMHFGCLCGAFRAFYLAFGIGNEEKPSFNCIGFILPAALVRYRLDLGCLPFDFINLLFFLWPSAFVPACGMFAFTHCFRFSFTKSWKINAAIAPMQTPAMWDQCPMINKKMKNTSAVIKNLYNESRISPAVKLYGFCISIF